MDLKHSRMSMFETVGYIVPEYTRLAGDLSLSYGVKFSDVPIGLAALSEMPAHGWGQVIASLGGNGLFVRNANVQGDPGNYGAGFLGLRSVGIVPGACQDDELSKMELNADIAIVRHALTAIVSSSSKMA